MTTISKAELEPILKEMAVERDYQEDLKGLTAEPWRPPVTIDLNAPPRYARGTTDGRDL